MVAGSRSTPSSVARIAIVAPTPPSSTSCTLSSTESGSSPSEKVRQACGSRSTSSTLPPLSASALPSEATVVVLATPPFWFATAITLLIRAIVPVPTLFVCARPGSVPSDEPPTLPEPAAGRAGHQGQHACRAPGCAARRRGSGDSPTGAHGPRLHRLQGGLHRGAGADRRRGAP